MTDFPTLVVTLPEWVTEVCSPGATYSSLEQRMDLAIELARRNVTEGSGGPFGAGIFDPVSGRLVTAGVNMVVSGKAAILHAETVAIALAGQATDSFLLAGLELVSSTEPCAMCLGAVMWSGLARLVCGARHEDAVAVGFDEGDKPSRWQEGLGSRGIEVVADVQRAEAREVLAAYVEAGGFIYNGRPLST
ncbi:MAG TPA: nucleoside deaminase [Acidimicrobiia bacterium]|nr:nucleoside deaminase [Acidimicrobiia bacterium]